MVRFLVTTFPFLGHLFPGLAIARALRERGHEVAFYTGARACAMVEAHGFACFPFKRIDGEALAERMAAGYGTREPFWRRAAKQKALFRSWLLDTIPGQLADLAEALPAFQPDVILSDVTMWGPSLVLHETQDAPVAVFSHTAVCLLPGPDAPPGGFGLPRPRDWRTRLLARTAGAALRFTARDFRRDANALRQRYNLPPIRYTPTEHTGRMPLHLVTSVPEFDFQRRDLPPSVQYVGPCLLSQPGQEPVGWIDELPHDRPWVYVSEGTNRGDAPIVLRAAAAGLAGRPMQVIMTTGGRRAPAELGLDDVAPNIRVERWVHDTALIPRTAALVTAGGAGTILTALRAGVPLVVVPTEWDKPDNARRVVESGAGLRLAPRRCTPDRLRAAVERVLSEPSFRQNAERLARACERCGGPARAAELLEEISLRAERYRRRLAPPASAAGSAWKQDLIPAKEH